ncbi:restriction endonuclease [Acidithiobacillus caldus]|uniref:Restriction endonuclease n=1 Tax=Acidithiobacillus caldus (strain SM-1) TaxID=990288 RepID=F9ZQP1_ACICS|nr:restriction endonuclease [Acidithiobacillus caldus]AEK58641.1 restriction endonuclease [Acidithiobacillus caldus SM-1]AUW33199.1 restriction endonuclease [Acidithiobacillus caldus]MBU2801543.1 restriction endonuclease [Acidithiobacillus caldus]QER45054.1 endonuclease [Acidithiobacillus caldus]
MGRRRRGDDLAMLGLLIVAAPILAVVWVFKFVGAHPWLWFIIVPASILVLAQVPKWQAERKRKADLLFANAKPAQMGPIEYERYCAEILRRDGWHTEMTPASGDQGVDVVATLQGFKAVLQCKRYSKPVGNRAVQEILAGKTYYRSDIAAVVSTAPYTPSAQALAKRCGVLLLSHTDLPDLRRQLPKP